MIRVERSHLTVVAETHPGMTGKNNEDRFAVSAYKLKRGGRLPALFAVLSDGIGGHRAGEVAAELAVERISQMVAKSSGKDPVETLSAAIAQASQEIYAQAQAVPERNGMGATCACAWIINDRLYTATVGDSRIYLIRDGAIQQVTKDHTWIQEALDKGVLKLTGIPMPTSSGATWAVPPRPRSIFACAWKATKPTGGLPATRAPSCSSTTCFWSAATA
jgi:serine/threonine protein phosphatase PrpC